MFPLPMTIKKKLVRITFVEKLVDLIRPGWFIEPDTFLKIDKSCRTLLFLWCIHLL